MGIYENIRIITLIKRFLILGLKSVLHYITIYFPAFLIVYIKEGMRKNGTCFFELGVGHSFIYYNCIVTKTWKNIAMNNNVSKPKGCTITTKALFFGI